MAELAIEKELNSAHGRKIHGHTFKVNVTFKGEVEKDMVSGIDFHDVINRVNEILIPLDKVYLNDIDGMGRATVENVAIYIIKKLKDIPSLDSVTVWEGPDRYVKIFSNEV